MFSWFQEVPNSVQVLGSSAGSHSQPASHPASTSGSVIPNLNTGRGQLSPPLASVVSSGPQLSPPRLCRGGDEITEEKSLEFGKIRSWQTAPSLRLEPTSHLSYPVLVPSCHPLPLRLCDAALLLTWVGPTFLQTREGNDLATCWPWVPLLKKGEV